MSSIHLMSLNLDKTTQKCSIFWNLLDVLMIKVLIKILNLSFIHFFSFKYFGTIQKCLLFPNLLGSFYK